MDVRNCTGCEMLSEVHEHFEAIFDFLDKHEIDYGELPFIRMDIHNHFGEPHRKKSREDLG